MHPKFYFSFSSAVVGGLAPERLVHSLTWERVANISGGKGENVGLALLSEFGNSHCKGIYIYTV